MFDSKWIQLVLAICAIFVTRQAIITQGDVSGNAKVSEESVVVNGEVTTISKVERGDIISTMNGWYKRNFREPLQLKLGFEKDTNCKED